MSTTLPSDKAVHLFRRAEVRWAQRLHHRKRNDKKGKWHIFWFVGFLIVVFLYCCLRVGLLFVKNFGDAIIWMISAVGTTSVDFPRPVCAEYAGQPLGLYFFPWYCSFSIFIYNGGVGTQTGYIYMELDTYIQPIGGVMLRLLRASAWPRTEKAPSAAIVRIMSFLINLIINIVYSVLTPEV